MSTYTKLIYHIVFSTKNREKTINTTHKRELYKYIWGLIDNKKCHLYRINGVEDHIHILTDMRPNMNISSFVKDIKVSSIIWMKERELFPQFTNWQVGYGAFTVSEYDKKGLIEYIKNQEEHHKKISFEEEYKQLLKQHNIEWDDKYLF